MGKDEDLQLQLDAALAECARLRAENSRLKTLLGLAETEAVSPAESLPHEQKAPEIIVLQQGNLFTVTNRSSTEEKIALFRSLFRGREDVYAVRWEGKSGSSGYSPSCRNEWHKVFCRKPKIKCSQCEYRDLLPLTDQVILNHLTGKHIVGLYPLLSDETCQILAVDFDKASWRDDAVAFLQTCKEMGVPAALERSRSGNGGHVWIFFDRLVEASPARKY
ncbi:MAG: hypothetical protein KGZ93_05620 [Actinobacteria bacterium]|nr:hypothetical protein [Actinomycetota bacterium]